MWDFDFKALLRHLVVEVRSFIEFILKALNAIGVFRSLILRNG